MSDRIRETAWGEHVALCCIRRHNVKPSGVLPTHEHSIGDGVEGCGDSCAISIKGSRGACHLYIKVYLCRPFVLGSFSYEGRKHIIHYS